MNQAHPRPSFRMLREQDEARVDAQLPPWARRTNPIVRRELGMNWKRLFPDVGLMAKLVLVQAALVTVVPPGFLMTMILPVAVMSAVVAPALVFLYGRVLVTVLNATAAAMVHAFTHHTLDLLRITHVSTDDIILGKIAASLWRRMDDMDMVLLGVSTLSLPFLAIYHFSGLQLMEIALHHRLMVAIGLLTVPPRFVLEPLMFGAVAVAAGTLLPSRSAAVSAAAAFAVFYYAVAITLLYIPMTFVTYLIFGALMPLLVPLFMTWIGVKVARWRVNHQ